MSIKVVLSRGLLCVFLLTGVSQPGMLAQDKKQGYPQLIPLCELLRNPEKHKGREVAVRASYAHAYEISDLFCLDCWSREKYRTTETHLLLLFGDQSLAKAFDEIGIFNAVFVGEFRYNKHPGGGHWRFEFLVKAIRDVETVYLSARVQDIYTNDFEFLPVHAYRKICGASSATGTPDEK